MARVLAHEMMGSLTPIVSLAESLDLLLERQNASAQTDGEIAGAVEAIKRRSLGLMSFVDRYREFSELPKPNLAPIEAAALLDGIERLLRPTFDAKRITYSGEISSGGLELFADRELLEQAIINLLRNAIDAVDGVAAPSIRVSCAEENGKSIIAVEDNGPGLGQKNTGQLFVPFFTTKAGGFGIGLSLARQIALAHGGDLEASDNSSSGATFRMTIPKGVEPRVG
jgi:signal transduction histidine kinase